MFNYYLLTCEVKAAEKTKATTRIVYASGIAASSRGEDKEVKNKKMNKPDHLFIKIFGKN